MTNKVLETIKNKRYDRQFVYSFIPIICFESANNCYIDNPLEEKLGIKKYPSFIVIWKDNYEDWGDGNIQKIKDRKQIEFIIDECRKIIKKHESAVEKLSELKYKKLSNEEIVKNLKIIDQISTEVYHRYIFLIHDYFETDDVEMIKILPEVRIEMSDFVDKIYYACNDIISALARMFDGVRWETFSYATFEELINLLENPEKINEFEKIYKRPAIFFFDGKELTVIKGEEEVLKIVDALGSQKQETLNANEIKGNIAYKGKSEGEVVIVTEFDYKNVGQVLKDKKNYILVTPMTRPEFVPYMSDCSAIVTDEGGITCHAAIVARELKIPCIIGTKIASQVLNNGDKVKVDAEIGEVRKLT